MDIKQLLLDAKITPMVLARTLGVCRQTISDWQKNDNIKNKSKVKLEKFCDKHGLNFNDYADNDFVFLECTADKYELPVAIYDSVDEIAERTGLKHQTIMKSIRCGCASKDKTKPRTFFVKVQLENEKKQDAEKESLWMC